jgi:trimethylamine--corrinoid protein Co-methyltransferase
MQEQAVRQRAGGRAARRRLREAEGCSPAVRPGHEGGAYRPLSDRDVDRVHETALDLLATIGMGDPIPELRAAALDRGCTLTEAGRLLFPRALVEDVIAGAGRDFVIHGRDPDHDIDVSGARVHFGCGGEAVTVLDFETGRYRPSTLVDFYDLARLTDRLEHVHRYSNIIVPTEIADLREMDINRTYAAVAGTTKACSMSVSKAAHMDDVIAMLDVVLGGEGRFLARPFASAGGCAIVSPLAYGEDNSEIVVAATRRGITTGVVVASQAGATAPAALAGALAQNTAETLAGLLLVNLIRPGHPMVFGNWPFVSDLRTGSFSGGGGEEAVLTAAAAQMGNFYDLPTSVGAGMTDSKLPDAQAGYEKGLTTALAGLAGANIVAEAVGMVGSLMGASFEAMVIDDDMLGAVNRAVRGIEVTDETLSFEVIREAVEGPGHFLGSAQTLALMESEYLYPRIGDRRAPAEWEEDGAHGIADRARERVREILSAHYPDYVDEAADARVRERFAIHLARADMLPGNGRW